MSSSLIGKSFFVGPTALWRGRERRRWWRRYVAIVRLGHTEPTEGAIAILMIVSGAIWYCSTHDRVITSPRTLGACLTTAGVIGLLGLSTRQVSVRAGFGFCGMLLRLWMTYQYLFSDFHDPVWFTNFWGAVIMVWILVRVICREAFRRGYRQGMDGDIIPLAAAPS